MLLLCLRREFFGDKRVCYIRVDFSFLGGILGFVFSLCGLSRAQKTGGEGAMMAKIGFAVSLVAMLCNEGIDVGKKSIRMQKLVTKTALDGGFGACFCG